MIQSACAPGEVDDDDSDVVAAAPVDSGARQHRRRNASGALAAGAALPGAPQASLRQATRRQHRDESRLLPPSTCAGRWPTQQRAATAGFKFKQLQAETAAQRVQSLSRSRAKAAPHGRCWVSRCWVSRGSPGCNARNNDHRHQPAGPMNPPASLLVAEHVPQTVAGQQQQLVRLMTPQYGHLHAQGLPF